MPFRLSLLAVSLLVSLSFATPASAAVLTESTDFPNAPPAFSLPYATTSVQGSVNQLDANDYFEFVGLTPGASFNFSGSFGGSGTISFVVFSTLTGLLGSGSTVSATVPLDGIVSVFVGSGLTLGGTYTVSMSSPLSGPTTPAVPPPSGDVPEPAPLALLPAGLALLAANAAWRRHRSW